MAIELIKSIKSAKKELRKFGLSIGIALGLLGGLFFLRQKDYYFYFFVFSGVFLLLSLVMPTKLEPLQKIWMGLAVVIGWLISRIILVLLLYLVVTPIGILARMFGKDFLNNKIDLTAQSYWIDRVPKIENYENQY